MLKTQLELPSHEVTPKTESLSEAQVGAYLAGAGNHEGKALFIIAMDKTQAGTENSFDVSGMHKLLTELPGSSEAYTGNVANQAQWCRTSLSSSGLVRAVTDTKSEFTLSTEGMEFGVPLAGMLLEFSEKHGVPLFEIFGGSASKYEVGSPLLRYMLATELLTHPTGATLEELVTASGASGQPVVEKHLRKLGIANLLQYEDWDEGVNKTRYNLADRQYTPSSRAAILLQEAIEHLKSAGESMSLDELIQKCYETVPDLSDNLDRNQVSVKLVSALHNLKSRGIVDQPEGRELNLPVKVSLTPKQELFWSELLEKLELFRCKDQDFMDHYRQVSRSMLTQPHIVANVLNRAHEASAHSGSDTKRSLGSLVLRAIAAADTPLSVREIVESVSEEQGRTYSHSGVVAVTGKLAQAGAVCRTEDKVVRYGSPVVTLKD